MAREPTAGVLGLTAAASNTPSALKRILELFLGPEAMDLAPSASEGGCALYVQQLAGTPTTFEVRAALTDGRDVCTGVCDDLRWAKTIGLVFADFFAGAEFVG